MGKTKEESRAASGGLSLRPGANGHAARAYANLEQEVFLHLQRTADLLMSDIEELLKDTGLSATQYNVLRILRANRERGLACHEITDRMATHDPDMTRLLDRLEQHKYVARGREKDDRRVVRVRVTAEGLSALKSLDDTVRVAHKRQLGHLGERRLRLLNRLLKEALDGKRAAQARAN
jgi:DNA-binding MarR family transcriptional regulator